MTRDDDFNNLFDLVELFPTGTQPAPEKPPTGPSGGPTPDRAVTSVLSAAERLRNHLHLVFSLCDERCKFPAPGRPFRVDDRNGSDKWKWLITVDVRDTTPPTLLLHLQSVPCDEQLRQMLLSLGVKPQVALEHATFEIQVRAPYAPTVRKLIPAVRLVARSTPARRWLTRRVCASLKRLADHLAEFTTRSPSSESPLEHDSRQPNRGPGDRV
ncbi:MAG: hypothetical protein C0501_23780 [Isosphaera sp.]|nr:hypothetical protein [Isosphaera sp.]